MALGLIVAGGPVTSADDVTLFDSTRDFAPRRTDPGADAPFDPAAHRLIDLIEMTIGVWEPLEPEDDLFDGEFDTDGEFLRLDVVVGGLVNPPGVAYPWEFEPFSYGDHPIFGFVEIDMDFDVETGGELDAPEYRYVGNVVRFGSRPDILRLEDRIALDGSAFDGDFLTPPYVERSGEEFHLALLGGQFEQGDIEEIAGDGDCTFDEGEIWQIKGRWFHRAHGYEPFSFAEGGAAPGEYSPDCTVQFRHDSDADLTCISLVFPLTNVGAALMEDEDPEPPNADPSDQASVREALIDLHESALFLDEYPTGLPEEAIITEWERKDPDDYLNPVDWELTVLLGSSYTAADPTGEYFVWTDVYPDGIRGDVNGDGEADAQDTELVGQFIADEDGSDGEIDGRVVLADFAWNFSVFDVNHDGVVDDLDALLVSVPGDFDDDDDVDLVDFGRLQACFSGPGAPFEPPVCGLADLDADGDVDVEDAIRFESAVTGPDGE